MSERPDLLPAALRWAEKAENDLRNADYVLGMGDGCPTDTVCFHCQQAAEKYLKALLILHDADVPRTHDLVLLHRLVGDVADLSLSIEDVQPLNRYSVEARYPGDWEPIDRDEAREALQMAKGVRRAARRFLHGSAETRGEPPGA